MHKLVNQVVYCTEQPKIEFKFLKGYMFCMLFYYP